MKWLETWAMWQVIGLFIGLGIFALFLLAFIIVVIKVFATETYKKHSKKYVYDCVRHEYVKKK